MEQKGAPATLALRGLTQVNGQSAAVAVVEAESFRSAQLRSGLVSLTETNGHSKALTTCLNRQRSRRRHYAVLRCLIE